MRINSLFPICNSVSIMLSVMALAGVGSFQPAYSADSNYYQFNDKGELVRPTGYREWVFVGTPLTASLLHATRNYGNHAAMRTSIRYCLIRWFA